MKELCQRKKNPSCIERRKIYEHFLNLPIKRDLIQTYEKASGRKGVNVSPILPPAA